MGIEPHLYAFYDEPELYAALDRKLYSTEPAASPAETAEAYIRWQDKQGYMMSEFLEPAPDEPEIPDTSERDAEVTAKLEAAQALIAEALDILNAKG